MPVLIHNAAHDHHRVIGLGGAEGLTPREQHIQQHPQAPPVHTVVVAVGQHIFWGYVSGCATEGVCAVGILQNLYTRECQLPMSLHVLDCGAMRSSQQDPVVPLYVMSVQIFACGGRVA